MRNLLWRRGSESNTPEPGRPAHSGFEDRGGHQAPFTLPDDGEPVAGWRTPPGLPSTESAESRLRVHLRVVEDRSAAVPGRFAGWLVPAADGRTRATDARSVRDIPGLSGAPSRKRARTPARQRQDIVPRTDPGSRVGPRSRVTRSTAATRCGPVVPRRNRAAAGGTRLRARRS